MMREHHGKRGSNARIGGDLVDVTVGWTAVSPAGGEERAGLATTIGHLFPSVGSVRDSYDKPPRKHTRPH